MPQEVNSGDGRTCQIWQVSTKKPGRYKLGFTALLQHILEFWSNGCQIWQVLPSPFDWRFSVGSWSGNTTPVKMIPLDEFKKLLGNAASDLSDAEIERLRDIEDRLADIIFDAWLRKRNPQPEIAQSSET